MLFTKAPDDHLKHVVFGSRYIPYLIILYFAGWLGHCKINLHFKKSKTTIIHWYKTTWRQIRNISVKKKIERNDPMTNFETQVKPRKSTRPLQTTIRFHIYYIVAKHLRSIAGLCYLPRHQTTIWNTQYLDHFIFLIISQIAWVSVKSISTLRILRRHLFIETRQLRDK